MRIAFTGDTSFHNYSSEHEPFESIKNALENVWLVVNLESPILEKSSKARQIKEKGGLKSSSEAASLLKSLPLGLINLSNNHVNDYGNLGVDSTRSILNKSGIKNFGAGLITEGHNIHIDRGNKIAYFSYTTRETDHAGSPLFNTPTLKGPKRLSEELFLEQSKKYSSFKKVILLHWGEEFVSFPSSEQRQSARDLIDLGADLIIGSHSHTVQGYEIYKGKYVFYSLGNFFMPDVKPEGCGKTRKWDKRENKSIVPIFDIGKDISLNKIILTTRDKDVLKVMSDKNLIKFLNSAFRKGGKEYGSFYSKEIRKMKVRKAGKKILSKLSF